MVRVSVEARDSVRIMVMVMVSVVVREGVSKLIVKVRLWLG